MPNSFLLSSFLLWLSVYLIAQITIVFVEPRNVDHFLVGYSGAITLMMEAVQTSKISIYFYETTRCHITESCHLQKVLSTDRELISVWYKRP
jgi:hypothetical protein